MTLDIRPSVIIHFTGCCFFNLANISIDLLHITHYSKHFTNINQLNHHNEWQNTTLGSHLIKPGPLRWEQIVIILLTYEVNWVQSNQSNLLIKIKHDDDNILLHWVWVRSIAKCFIIFTLIHRNSSSPHFTDEENMALQRWSSGPKAMQPGYNRARTQSRSSFKLKPQPYTVSQGHINSLCYTINISFPSSWAR